MPTVTSPSLNVYSGPNALVDFYDPDKCPPAPLVEVPEHPWREQGVRIYAKLMSALPAANVKSLPALNMLLRARESGELTPETKTIIEYSSGSTVISLGILANIMGIETVKAYLSNKTSPAKLDLLRFFNWESHIRWTAHQILKQLPDIKVFATCIGTSGTVTGCGLSLKRYKPDITRVGVCTSPNDRIPGPRMYSLLEPVTWFPWREAIDTMMEVSSPEAFEYSLHLCRNGLLVGPSSGMAMLGLFRFLERTMKEKGTLDHLRNEDGEIPCVFICCDGPFQYISEYYDKLPESHFHPIRNSELLGVDSYSYNLDWEMTPAEAHSILFWPKGPSNPSPRVPNDRGKMDFDSSSEVVVLDLRAEGDYKHMKLPNAFNLPIGRTQNPYTHPPTMVEIFKEIDGRVGLGASNDLVRCLDGKVVFTLGYDGHIARLAMSVLRNRGLEAYCIMGGVEEWETLSLAPFGMSN
ncbi:unnamed protein product [Rhizoctonia solani]|uniref:Rhodanese domain-containing protein n=1 Tax=Rhizoctonia solani TaxID=456999 RepID=A0A8H3CVF1_9AGAM|nr:unnamed protein product [Rhizoctonia solani]CAE6492658.1 unnamed protein product [Rhizoctonia solani]